jgi:hypothetical protein
MNMRLQAAFALLKPKLKDLLLNPGVFVAAAVSTALGLVAVKSFTTIVGSGRLLFEQNPLYFLIRKTIEPLFGETVFTKLFSEGPFLFSLFIAMVPFFVYMLFFSAYSLGFEKNSGVVTLISFGPADYSAFSLSNILRDMIFTAAFMLYLLVFFLLLKGYFGLALGARFWVCYVLFFFLFLALFSLVPLVVALTRSPGNSVLLLIVISAALLIVDISSFIIAGTYIETLAELLSSGFRWISPFSYFRFGLTAVEGAGLPALAAGIAALTVFTGAVFLLTSVIERKKGAA